jgi:DNA-binding NarL/FixJ family response regulator
VSEDFSYLPKLLAEIAEVAGLGAALLVAREKGGGRASFPAMAQVAPGNWLHDLVGEEAALKIADRFTSRGSIELEVPLGPEGARSRSRDALYRMIAEGKSSGEIARVLRITRRTVVRNRRRLREEDDGRQGRLF